MKAWVLIYKGKIIGMYNSFNKAHEYAKCLDGFEHFNFTAKSFSSVNKWTLNGRLIIEIRYLPNVKR